MSRSEFLLSKILTNVLLSLMSVAMIGLIALITGLIYSPFIDLDRVLTDTEFLPAYFLEVFFFLSYALMLEMLRAVTGWAVTADELRDTARRILAAKREVNRLAGWTPEEDTLPDRFFDDPLPNDLAAVLTREQLQELVDEYYRQRSDARR
jgi:hypothetical protein